MRVKLYLTVVLIYIFQMISDIKNLLINFSRYRWPWVYFLWKKCLFYLVLCPFWVGLFAYFCCCCCCWVLYILCIFWILIHHQNIWIIDLQIFSLWVFFNFIDNILWWTKAFHFHEFLFAYLFFCCLYVNCHIQKIVQILMFWSFLLCFLLSVV